MVASKSELLGATQRIRPQMILLSQQTLSRNLAHLEWMFQPRPFSLPMSYILHRSADIIETQGNSVTWCKCALFFFSAQVSTVTWSSKLMSMLCEPSERRHSTSVYRLLPGLWIPVPTMSSHYQSSQVYKHKSCFSFSIISERPDVLLISQVPSGIPSTICFWWWCWVETFHMVKSDKARSCRAQMESYYHPEMTWFYNTRRNNPKNQACTSCQMTTEMRLSYVKQVSTESAVSCNQSLSLPKCTKEFGIIIKLKRHTT